MTTPHGEMKLRDYVRTVVPEVKPDMRPYHWRELVRAVDQFGDWLGEDIAAADVTPDMVREFAIIARPKWMGFRLKAVMRTFDPMMFRQRSPGSGKPAELNRGNGSEFLLANVYLNHYEPTAIVNDLVRDLAHGHVARFKAPRRLTCRLSQSLACDAVVSSELAGVITPALVFSWPLVAYVGQRPELHFSLENKVHPAFPADSQKCLFVFVVRCSIQLS